MAAVLKSLNEMEVEGAVLVVTSWLEDRGLQHTRTVLHEEALAQPQLVAHAPLSSTAPELEPPLLQTP